MGRGGCQGTTSMPRIFIVAMHYVYVKHDPERLDRLYGPAEASDRTRASKCLLCAALYPVKKYEAAGMDTGCCRACQLVTALSPEENETDDVPGTEVRRRTRSCGDGADDIAARTPAPRPRNKTQAQQAAHVSASRLYPSGETDTESEDSDDASPSDVFMTPRNGAMPAPRVGWSAEMSDEAEMAWGRQQYDQQVGRGSLVVPDSVFADDAVGLMACERFESAPKERKLEHRVLAERMGARFDQVAKGAYKT